MKTKTTLSPPEVSFALSIATQRDACKANRSSRHSTKMSGFGVHFVGVIGELCFRKVYGGKMNVDILPEGDSHRADIVLADGRNVEVKSRTWNSPDPIVIFEMDELDALEHCSMVQVALPDIGVVWPIWDREFILRHSEKKDFGYGERLAFHPERHMAAS